MEVWHRSMSGFNRSAERLPDNLVLIILFKINQPVVKTRHTGMNAGIKCNG